MSRPSGLDDLPGLTAATSSWLSRSQTNVAAEVVPLRASRGSGRVGRTAGARAFDPAAVTLAVVAAVRHGDTEYDDLLMVGVDRSDARHRVHAAVDEVLELWRTPVAWSSSQPPSSISGG